MLTLLLISQSVIVILLISAVLLQQNSADGLSGLAGGGHGVISGKSSANFMTKTTFILAFLFMANSLCLAKMTIIDLQKSGKMLESIEADSDELMLEVEPEIPTS